MKKPFEVTGLQSFVDNDIWIIRYLPSNECIVVNPRDADIVMPNLADTGTKLYAILITHLHWDHMGGVNKLQQQFPAAKVYSTSAEKESSRAYPLNEQRCLRFWNQLIFKVLLVPGYTQRGKAICETTRLYSKQLTALPTVLRIEHEINPFLRCDHQHFIEALVKHGRPRFSTALDRFTYVRQLKNDWQEVYSSYE